MQGVGGGSWWSSSLYTAGSAVALWLKRLVVQMDATAVLTAVMPLVKLSRAAAIPTGGTVLAKGKFDAALAFLETMKPATTATTYNIGVVSVAG